MNGEEEVQDLLRCVFDIHVMETSDVTGLSHKAIEKKLLWASVTWYSFPLNVRKKRVFFGGKVNTDSLFAPQTGIE